MGLIHKQHNNFSKRFLIPPSWAQIESPALTGPRGQTVKFKYLIMDTMNAIGILILGILTPNFPVNQLNAPGPSMPDIHAIQALASYT